MTALREMRQRCQLSMEALAKRVGTSASQINKLEKGERRLTEEWLHRLATALECAPGDLLNNPSSRGLSAPAGGGAEFVDLPVCSLSSMDTDGPAAGIGRYLYRTTFRRDWLQPVSNVPARDLVVYVVATDALEPTIRSGAYAVAEPVNNGLCGDGLYVVEMGGSLAIRRITQIPGGDRLSVRADNPAYPSSDHVERNGVRLVARIIWAGAPV